MEDIIYSWNYNPLEVVYNEGVMANVVNVVHWQLLGTYSGSSVSEQRIGTVGLETPDPASFIPFEELTEEIVNGWVEAKLSQETVTEIKANISASINSRLFPTRGPVTPPWIVP